MFDKNFPEQKIIKKKKMKYIILALLLTSSISAGSSKYQCLRDILSLGKIENQRGIAIQGSSDVKTMLTLYDNMPKEIQTKIKACSLNLKPALDRCEKSYGKGNCEKISAAEYQTKCDQYFQRVGCCHCAMKCPVGWKEDDYHCVKPNYKETKKFKEKKACEAGGKKCELRAGIWTPRCGINYKRVSEAICIPVCPEGWHDEGERCRKPADYRMAQPFLWQIGDN